MDVELGRESCPAVVRQEPAGRFVIRRWRQGVSTFPAMVMDRRVPMCFVGIASAEEPLVVVHDGSFEASAQNPQLGHWALHCSSGAFDNQTAFDGNVSAKLQGPQRFTAEWTYEFPNGLVAGREYVVSAWVKAERDGAVASLGVRWSGGYPRIYRGLQAESDWQRMEMLFTVPVPAPDRMEIVLSGDHDGALWWDRVEIFEACDLGRAFGC